ncbi:MULTISPECIES: hypothetical protein [Nocardioides]|uniref:DUF1850 domain-containing protein n=1 Tax=Nocardioides vastitatis TaxID=2568655 RepID=A0ABW0ZFS6_9ACTN|nr:hypothetical protein [Nocardioides sp.]THI99268.1 hypothetical protein E7Z54_12880 [Nocardioides sp.]
MSLLVRHEHEASYDLSSTAGDVPSRRRRGLWALVVVTGLVVGWAFSPALVRLDPGVAPQLPVDAGLMVSEYGAEGTYALHYRHHETVTLTVPLRNTGPLPLSVDDIRLEGQPRPLLVPVGAGLPVRLEPWGTAEVTWTMRFDNCRYYHERSADMWERILVAGSVLGRGFESEVTLAHPLVVHGQVINNCPDRTLTRGDDVRRP